MHLEGSGGVGKKGVILTRLPWGADTRPRLQRGDCMRGTDARTHLLGRGTRCGSSKAESACCRASCQLFMPLTAPPSLRPDSFAVASTQPPPQFHPHRALAAVTRELAGHLAMFLLQVPSENSKSRSCQV